MGTGIFAIPSLDHFDLSFPENHLNMELNSNTDRLE